VSVHGPAATTTVVVGSSVSVFVSSSSTRTATTRPFASRTTAVARV
jgi:hypothetical protein